MKRQLYSVLIWLTAMIGFLPLVSSAQDAFDSVVDMLGNRWHISQLRLPATATSTPPGQTIIPATCASGYFQLFYDTSSGLDGNSSLEIARQDVLCKLFADLSAFINSRLPITGARVNVLISALNPTNFPGVPSSAAGVATSYYTMPFTTFGQSAASRQAVLDNVAWSTITTGSDGFVLPTLRSCLS